MRDGCDFGHTPKMSSMRTPARPNSLGLGGDDDVDFIRAIEGSFGVRFGDETIGWFTVDDIYKALLASMPEEGSSGLCSTSMAFYRLRAALARRNLVQGRVGPATKLAGLVSMPPRELFALISEDLGVAPLSPALSWWGSIGVLLSVIGFCSIFFILSHHALWPLLLLMLLGAAMTSTDVGAYRSTTMGGLARRVAALNYKRFASMGADTRPTSVWRALCDLIAHETDVEANLIRPDTRLLA